jgi:hypothetical protein
VISCRYCSKDIPAAASCWSIAALFRPPVTPTRMGVPTAPKVTGVLWTIMPSMTAAAAGKPSATSSGAAMAAGVPKPDAPSMKQPKSQAMITVWTRRSVLIRLNPARIEVIAPECFSVLSSRIAPKMMSRMSNVMMRPCTVDAATRANGTFQSQSAMTTAAT